MVIELKKISLTLVCVIGLAIMNCSQEINYGLESTEGHFEYSYFVVGSELLVKNRIDFDNQFENEEFRKLEQFAARSEKYIQPEVLHLPVIQKIIPGNKVVMVFETTEKSRDGLKLKRLAIECDKGADKMSFPDDFKGYFMIDDWEWPPKIFDIVGGDITIDYYSDLTGQLSGQLDIVILDDVFKKGEKKISGSFTLLEMSKAMFLSIPARYSSKP